jgi:hypothetical protein
MAEEVLTSDWTVAVNSAINISIYKFSITELITATHSVVCVR